MCPSRDWSRHAIKCPFCLHRSAARVMDTVQEITEATGNKNIKGYEYDFASMDQIHQFATAVRTDYNSIDVLVNNAGVYELYWR